MATNKWGNINARIARAERSANGGSSGYRRTISQRYLAMVKAAGFMRPPGARSLASGGTNHLMRDVATITRKAAKAMLSTGTVPNTQKRVARLSFRGRIRDYYQHYGVEKEIKQLETAVEEYADWRFRFMVLIATNGEIKLEGASTEGLVVEGKIPTPQETLRKIREYRGQHR